MDYSSQFHNLFYGKHLGRELRIHVTRDSSGRSAEAADRDIILSFHYR